MRLLDRDGNNGMVNYTERLFPVPTTSVRLIFGGEAKTLVNIFIGGIFVEDLVQL